MDLDFASLNARLIFNARTLLETWLPGGRVNGREYVCAGLGGGKGDSLSVNIQTGRWADFATDDKGGDLISLYAAIHGIGQGEAFKHLDDGRSLPAPRAAARPEPTPSPQRLGIPPPGTPPPVVPNASHLWAYNDATGNPMFYVSRQDTDQGKQIRPLSWDLDAKGWVFRSLPTPRPLYGLDLLAARPNDAVMIVEGEKAADAARALAGHVYVVVTWPNGAVAHQKADWSPVHGRRVLIWPDNDLPGQNAAQAIAEALAPVCPEVKIIDPSIVDGTQDQASAHAGWDAADALAEGMTWETFKAWAKPRISLWKPPTSLPLTPEVEVLPRAAAPTPTEVTVTMTEDAAPLTQSVAAICATYNLAVNGKAGHPLTNTDNCTRVLSAVPGFTDLVWWDEFHARLFTGSPAREWTDADTLALLVRFQRELGFQKLSDSTLYQALVVYGRERRRNEPRDWMDSLTWDGTPRIESFFVDAFGTKDTEYTRAASRNWWVSMVARVYQPGCKVDTMVILEGAQGAGKSQALSIIGGPWFAEATESVTSKDFFLCLSGKLILEIAELDAFSRAEATRIKQVITAQVDRYRTPYGRLAEDNPRRCVFVGTTNDSSYLRDNTGGRRFWPIEVGEIRLDLIRANRDQLFAEAVSLLKNGARWHEMPAQAADEQEDRRHHDEWESTVAEFIDQHKDTGVTVKQIWTDGMGNTAIKDLDGRTQWRIIHILQALKWKVRVVRRDGGAKRVYFHPDHPPF